MKLLIILTFILGATFSFGQNIQKKDSIQPPKYDTTNITLKSTNSFYFGNKLYRIPRNCVDKDQLNCCSFRTIIDEPGNEITNGSFNCDNGTFLSWFVYNNEEIAKRDFESNPDNMKRQMKKYKQEDVLFLVYDKKVKAFKQTYTTFQDHTFEEYVFYGPINGKMISGKLRISHKEKSSSELSPFFQQLFRF